MDGIPALSSHERAGIALMDDEEVIISRWDFTRRTVLGFANLMLLLHGASYSIPRTPSVLVR
jgi:hypothetical protein